MEHVPAPNLGFYEPTRIVWMKLTAILIGLACGLALASWVSFVSSSKLGEYLVPSLMAGVLFVYLPAQMMLLKLFGLDLPSTELTENTADFHALANKFGITLNGVEVLETFCGRRRIFATNRSGKLRISRLACNSLSAQVLQALAAEQFALDAASAYQKRLLISVCTFAIATGVSYVLIHLWINPRSHTDVLFPSVIMAGTISQGVYGWVRTLQRENADYKAISVTRDRDAYREMLHASKDPALSALDSRITGQTSKQLDQRVFTVDHAKFDLTVTS